MTKLHRFLGLGLLALAGASLSGCDQGGAVAYVNGTQIPQEDYFSLLEINRTSANSQAAGIAILNQLIENRLLVQEARHEGVAPTSAELQAALTELRQNPATQEEITRTGLSEEQVLRLILEPSMSATRLYAKMAGVTDADVKKFYEQNKAQFRQPEQVRVRVLQVADKKTAEQALSLVGKSTFDSIIQTLKGTSAMGGDPTQIQTMAKGGFSIYPKSVVDAAFGTPKGKASGVIEGTPQANFLQPQGPPPTKQYYVVYVEDKIPPREPDINNPSIKDQALQAVARQKGATMSPTALQDLMARLRQAASVSVVRPAVKAAEKPPAPTPAQGLPNGAAPAPAPSAPPETAPPATTSPAPAPSNAPPATTR